MPWTPEAAEAYVRFRVAMATVGKFSSPAVVEAFESFRTIAPELVTSDPFEVPPEVEAQVDAALGDAPTPPKPTSVPTPEPAPLPQQAKVIPTPKWMQAEAQARWLTRLPPASDSSWPAGKDSAVPTPDEMVAQFYAKVREMKAKRTPEETELGTLMHNHADDWTD